MKKILLIMTLLVAVLAIPSEAALQVISTSSPAPAVQKKDYTVYITNTGERYHRGDCRYLRKSKIPIKKSEAVAQGYTPCKVCRP